MPYYDVHAHLADNRILPDIDNIIADCNAAGVKHVLANAARLQEWSVIIELSKRFEIIDGALGLHPFFIDQWHDQLISGLKKNINQNPQIIAIGEIGLDFYHGRNTINRQIQAFSEQLLLAQELKLPVILHNRKSWTEFFSVLKNLNLTTLRGVCHHFTGSNEIATQLLDTGLYLSFCGPLTYPNAKKIKQAAAYVPLDRILTETDSPDLPAQQYRGQYSYPYHVAGIVKELAKIKDCSETCISQQIEQNYHTLFSSDEK